MQLRTPIGQLQSPSFQTVVAIAGHAGPGMVVDRFQSIRCPAGTVQVWEFVAKMPPLDRPPVVVAVLVVEGRLASWSPAVVDRYDGAVDHYRQLAQTAWAKAKAEGASAPAAVAPAPANAIALPALPPGVRVILPTTDGQPPRLGGQPVRWAATAGAP
jgi:hypothetical protein